MKEENKNNHPEGCTCEECQQKSTPQQKKKMPWGKIALAAGVVVVAYLYGKNEKKVNGYIKKSYNGLKDKVSGKKEKTIKEEVIIVENATVELPAEIYNTEETVINEPVRQQTPRRSEWRRDGNWKRNDNKKAI